MWKSLTPEQEALLSAYVERWHVRVAAQPPPDRHEVWNSTKDLYKALGISEPRLMLCDGPWQIVAMAVLLQLIFVGDELIGGESLMQWLGERLTEPKWALAWKRLVEQFERNFSPDVKVGTDNAIAEAGSQRWAGLGTRIAPAITLGIWDKLVLKIDSQIYKSTDTCLYGYIRGKLFGGARTSWIADAEGDTEAPVRTVSQQLAAQLSSMTMLARQQNEFRLSRLRGRANPRIANAQPSIPADDMFEQQLMDQLGADGVKYFEAKLEQLSDHLSSAVDHRSWAMGAPESMLARFISAAATSFVSMILWQGGQERWLPFYSFPLDAVGDHFYDPDTVRLLRSWTALLGNTVPFMPFSEVCFVSDQPMNVNLDDRGRLHNAGGKAIEYPDGFCLYSWHGTTVPDFAIEHPEQITADRIESEGNIEVRRVLIELYGTAKYLRDSGTKEVHRDAFGVLYRKNLTDDEPIVMVAVTNSTAELDGSFHQYFLRVPPTIRTAREAVAWTFGMDSPEYRPKFQT